MSVCLSLTLVFVSHSQVGVCLLNSFKQRNDGKKDEDPDFFDFMPSANVGIMCMWGGRSYVNYHFLFFMGINS